MDSKRIERSRITGLVLAGGRGSRMGGLDKGLQLYRGVPLAQHALQRLAPQVGALVVNANRNLPAYAAMGAAVWPDSLPDHAGPLAGWLVGLDHLANATEWLVTVPCDCPLFPTDLVERLTACAVREDAEIVIASGVEDGVIRTQPVFALLHRSLRDSLAACLAAGERKVDRWTARHRMAICAFDRAQDAGAFANANTLDELAQLNR